jgi:hypothetical protein
MASKWEPHKDRIKKLYQKKTLQEVADIVRDEIGFEAR